MEKGIVIYYACQIDLLGKKLNDLAINVFILNIAQFNWFKQCRADKQKKQTIVEGFLSI